MARLFSTGMGVDPYPIHEPGVHRLKMQAYPKNSQREFNRKRDYNLHHGSYKIGEETKPNIQQFTKKRVDVASLPSYQVVQLQHQTFNSPYQGWFQQNKRRPVDVIQKMQLNQEWITAMEPPLEEQVQAKLVHNPAYGSRNNMQRLHNQFGQFNTVQGRTGPATRLKGQATALGRSTPGIMGGD